MTNWYKSLAVGVFDYLCATGPVSRKTAIAIRDEIMGFGPGWPTLQQEPPDLVEVPFAEAVELLLKHWSPSVQVMLETLKQKYRVVLARSPK